MNQLRQPQGTPIGGQWATGARDEPKFGSAELADVQTMMSNVGIVVTDAEAAEALRVFKQTVRAYRDRIGDAAVDEDDMAQEVAEAWLKRRAAGRGVDNLKAYARTHGNGQVVGALRNTTGRTQQHIRAMGLYHEALATEANQLGRKLTPAEEDRIATKIQADMLAAAYRRAEEKGVDPKKYATWYQLSKGWHRNTGRSFTSFDPTFHDREQESNRVGSLDPDQIVDQQIAALEAKRSRSETPTVQALVPADAKAVAYPMLASRMPSLPKPQPGSLTPSAIAKARKTVSEHPGGVVGAMRDWQHGETNPATEAVFKAFGGLGGDDGMDARDKVSDLFLSQPTYAEDLWVSALKCSSPDANPGGKFHSVLSAIGL